MKFRALLLVSLLSVCALPGFADDAQPVEETPEELRTFVASFNLARPKDFEPLLVEDIICSRELKSEILPIGEAFPHFPQEKLSKTELVEQDKIKLRTFRQMLADIVARRKSADVKAAATQSTRFGPTFRELGQNILATITDIDAALKIDAPTAYLRAALRVRANGDEFNQTLDHTARAFSHLSYEYRTIDALTEGKPRPVWKEPEPHTPDQPLDESGSALDLQVD